MTTRREVLFLTPVLFSRAQDLRLDIWEACTEGNLERLTQLVNDDPGLLNIRAHSGATPLYVAAAAGQAKAVSFLIGKGANPNLVLQPLGDTPLRAAVGRPDRVAAESMAQSLAGNGADPNGRALHAAAEYGHVNVARMLIRRGAGVDVRDKDGRTPLDIAIQNRQSEVAEVLRHHELVHRTHWTSRYSPGVVQDDTHGIPQIWINQFVTLAHTNLEKVKELYGKCPELLNTRATWNELGVEAAAHMGYKEAANFFLDKGAPVCLSTAAMMGMASRVKELLQEDADRVWERGAHDFPLLWYPAFGGGHADIAEILIDHGADVNTALGGRTALDLASQKGQTKLVELLLAKGATSIAKDRASDR